MIFRQATRALLKRFRVQCQAVTACRGNTNGQSLILSSKKNNCSRCISQGYSCRGQTRGLLWLLASGQAAFIFGIGSCPVLAEESSSEISSENGKAGPEMTGLQRIEDGSVISNEHTSKWRIFTDNGREFFMQGKLHEAERFFLSAVEEAKEGFGERDPHVASAYNNMAELYRVKKAYDKAEPLYLEAIDILKESFGPEDVRSGVADSIGFQIPVFNVTVGAAFHNLGQFYLVQRKLEEARVCYENFEEHNSFTWNLDEPELIRAYTLSLRALMIKGRVLGYAHTDYADTMYHLGTVLYLLGKQKDAEVLIQDSIRILEDGGLGESPTCIKRLWYLAQIYLNSKELEDAATIQRKILHVMEVTKGWNSLDTVIVAERLALTLQAVGSLNEAGELLRRCLDVRKFLLPENHIQIGANMLGLARLTLLNAEQLMKSGSSKVAVDFDRAKELLQNSIRIAQGVLDALIGQKRNVKAGNDGHTAFIVLLQSFNALSRLEMIQLKLHRSEEAFPKLEAENALRQCISTFKKYGTGRPIFASVEAKTEYLSCLKHLSTLTSDSARKQSDQSGKASVDEELDHEIKRVEAELSKFR